MASGGNGNVTHLVGEMFKMMTGINMVHLPYRGGGRRWPTCSAGRCRSCSPVWLQPSNTSEPADNTLNHIPYKGGGPAMMDLVAGHVRIATLTFSSAAEQIRAGTVRALAVSSEQRLANFPDIPTFRELGYDDMVSTTWFALSGPARLPPAIVRSVSRETAKVLQQADVRRRFMRDEIELKAMTPEEVTRFISSEIARWSSAAKAAAKGDSARTK
jgi:tripartite-type tricarboxylate transporter receptor subunit TctC